MKIFRFFMILVCISSPLFSEEANSLPFYKETEYFKMHCMPIDYSIVDDILKSSEIFFKQLSQDFNHCYSKPKIFFYMYPDIMTFHTAINKSDAPDWLIGHHSNNCIKGVSPNNPGSYHTFSSVLKSQKVGLVTLFIEDILEEHVSVPRWLHQGIALYKAEFFSEERIKKLADGTFYLPTFDQLEKVGKYDTMAFDKLNGFLVSYSLVKYLDQQWGWQVLLELLHDYSKFEDILGVSKTEFEKSWREYLKVS